MEIVPRQVFRDVRSIPARFSRFDPRPENFNQTEVAVNLKDCTSVHPPAALWCAVYLLLARQREIRCLLIAPDDVDEASKLAEFGLLPTLGEAAVEVLSKPVSMTRSSGVILPLTRFDDLKEAADLTNHVEDTLYSAGFGSANIHPVVCELFSELVNNAAEHSESSIGAYSLIKFSTSGQERRFELCVADGGIGIAKSLERNPNLRHAGHEWTALELAVKEMVSGTSSSTRGIGLFSIFEESHVPGRELTIHSGNAILTTNRRCEIRITRANLFPGTLVYLSIPT